VRWSIPLFSPGWGGLDWPRGRERVFGTKASSLGGRLGRLVVGEGGGGLAEVENLEGWEMLHAWRWSR